MTKLAILRTKDKKEESVQLAQEMGFEVIFASPLELAEVDSAKFWQFVDELESGKVDLVILTSSTAVKYMLQLLNKKGRAEGAVRKLNQKGIIAIGPNHSRRGKTGMDQGHDHTGEVHLRRAGAAPRCHAPSR